MPGGDVRCGICFCVRDRFGKLRAADFVGEGVSGDIRPLSARIFGEVP